MAANESGTKSGKTSSPGFVEASPGAGIAADAVKNVGRETAAEEQTVRAAPSVSTLLVGTRTYRTRRASPSTGNRTLDILPDLPDIRDRIYQPNLQRLKPSKSPRIAFSIRDQGKENSCVGHALAHVLDVLLYSDDIELSPQRPSARMLYEIARRNDEWAESPHEGSSLRGAIKGFFRNGVCGEGVSGANADNWILTYEMAKQARETRLGAYFRIQPDISDYHTALNELGAIYVSAQIHENWKRPVDGKIAPGGATLGGHAFVIVGYDAEGFWVLNSWGETWGKDGTAHWSYSDWAATVMDAWVLQLGVKAPEAFGAIAGSSPSSRSGIFGIGDPNRAEILGHFINIDDGRLIETGKYASPRREEMQETVKRLISPDSNSGEGYQHLVIYAHGGLNSTVAEAHRIAAWKRADIFGRNGLYNFHLMWASDFLDEALGGMSKSTAGLAGSGFSDWLFEAGPGKYLGNRAWRNMKGDAEAAFSGRADYDGGYRGLLPLFQGLDKAESRPRIHLVGHSAGSIVLGRLLSALDRFKLTNIEVDSIHLMAPACTVEFFTKHYRPYLKGERKIALKDKTYLYMMSDALELADTVGSDIPLTPSYSHSLLYLVSRAYEERPNTPIAGMQLYHELMPSSAKLGIDLSMNDATKSRSHGGFDNDAATLTTIMSRILGGKAPQKPPRPEELTGY
ncbi:C1 family peptidase [Rhizobium leguminosarum]|uniref:C1 family peptidase n=1 Tax=Rhizobium leguminosarum TaxID=384 RepID=A0AAJ1ABS7_RHILE|nr:C1 family peptidase [Rhizobium leguminosarum]MBY5630905.1 C1 family peptidase [Rhizobium leguminosarum]